MQDNIDFLYERLGKYLVPSITNDFAMLRRSTLEIHDGVCLRTNLNGRVVDYVEAAGSTRQIIPTLAKILWIFSGQEFVGNEGRGLRMTSGHVLAVSEDRLFTTREFKQPIPDLEVASLSKILLKMSEKANNRYIFLSFTNKPSTVLNNSLRWSVGNRLEVNGRLDFYGNVCIEGKGIDLKPLLKISEVIADKKDIKKIWWLLRKERSDFEQRDLVRLIDKTNLSREQQILLFSASETEVNLALRLMENE